MRELCFFDPKESVSVLERRLPHWSQAGVVCFITFRTHDSFASETLKRFHADRRNWLRCHQINPDAVDWRQSLQALDVNLQREFFRVFSTRWHEHLDRGEGACLLAQESTSKIVYDSLLHFDGDPYEMSDFVVMPNHVHLLVAFKDEASMLSHCESWKHFTARQINLAHGQSGRFWQQDGFDHLVRSVEQFERFRTYIANNPIRANFVPNRYSLYRSHHAPP